MTDVAALSVEELRVVIAGTDLDVVSEVDFDVSAGSVLGLVGESGSGKTTVAHALLGFTSTGLDVVAGRVLIDGTDVLRLDSSQLRETRGHVISYVPQDPASALNPALRVGKQLTEALSAHRKHLDWVTDPQARIEQVLRDVRLEPSRQLMRAYPHQLSGGQQQRVVIAMAFVCRPRVIVLDEPTTGLDVTTQHHILETLRELCSLYGVAAVYVSHDLAVVSELATRVAVMYGGRIVEIGPTDRLFADPRHPYTQGLLRAVPSDTNALELTGIPGYVAPPGRRPPGCSFEPRCPIAIPQCSEAVPTLEPIDNQRFARCIRVNETRVNVMPVANARKLASVPEETVSLLGAQNMNAFYGDKQVLHEVSMSVLRQQCVGVVGESGSGKTTLARALVGLHTSYTGTVTFDGAVVPPASKDRDPRLHRAIQYIFQNPQSSLNPRKTVSQILTQALRQFWHLTADEQRQRIADALREVSLSPDEYLGKYPGELSGGEGQRVAIARALIVEPDVLICDEVTASLDASVQALTIELICALQASRGLGLVFITHNLPLVRSIAQTVVVLRDGVVVEHGPLADVWANPTDPYTTQLLEDAPRLTALDRGPV